MTVELVIGTAVVLVELVVFGIEVSTLGMTSSSTNVSLVYFDARHDPVPDGGLPIAAAIEATSTLRPATLG